MYFMRKFISSVGVVALVSITLFSCSGNKVEKKAELTNAELNIDMNESVEYQVSSEKSELYWSGEMLGLYGHSGLLFFKESKFRTYENQVIGGSFVIDMKSMVTIDGDELYVNGSRQELLDHLKSTDFFDVNNYPEAKLVITEIQDGSVIGDLTIKGITFPETIERVSLMKTKLGLELSGMLIFNRQDYDVYYSHPMKDMIISDEIVLKIVAVGELVEE